MQHFLFYLLALSQHAPLPVFTAIGSLVEELISPIPTQAVMFLAGSLARAGRAGLGMLVFMAVTGALGKVIGSFLYYFFADKIEDVIVPRFGKYIGISHEQLERVGKRLGRGWRDDIGLLILRLIPAVPSAPVSVACGLFKIDLRTFIWTAFVGSFARNALYLLIGYYGWSAYQRFIHSFAPYKPYFFGALAIVSIILLVFAYRYWKKRRS